VAPSGSGERPNQVPSTAISVRRQSIEPGYNVEKLLVDRTLALAIERLIQTSAQRLDIPLRSLHGLQTTAIFAHQ
jgi:hypothetical protein